MNIIDILVYLSISLVTGISIGLVGIGSGILFIPALVSYGINIKTAIVVGLVLQVIPQSLPGLYLYYKKGLVDIPLSIWCIIGSTLGIYIGSYISTNKYITVLSIYRLLFIITFITSLYIGYKYARIPEFFFKMDDLEEP